MTNAKLFEKLMNLTKNTDDVDREQIKKLRKVLRNLKKPVPPQSPTRRTM